MQGRWRSLTLRLDIGLTFAMCGALAWVVLAGAIFQAGPLNRWAEFLVVLVILGALVDAGLKVRREWRRAAPPLDLILSSAIASGADGCQCGVQGWRRWSPEANLSARQRRYTVD